MRGGCGGRTGKLSYLNAACVVRKFRVQARVMEKRICCPHELIFRTTIDCDDVAQPRVVYMFSWPHLSAPKRVLCRNRLAWPCARSSGRERVKSWRKREKVGEASISFVVTDVISENKRVEWENYTMGAGAERVGRLCPFLLRRAWLPHY